MRTQEEKQTCHEYWDRFDDFLRHRDSIISQMGSETNRHNALRIAEHTHVVATFNMGGAPMTCQIVYQGNGRAESTAQFDRAVKSRPEIDASFGSGLEWRRAPDKNSSRIVYSDDGDLLNTADEPQQFEWLATHLDRLCAAFYPYLENPLYDFMPTRKVRLR